MLLHHAYVIIISLVELFSVNYFTFLAHYFFINFMEQDAGVPSPLRFISLESIFQLTDTVSIYCIRTFL